MDISEEERVNPELFMGEEESQQRPDVSTREGEVSQQVPLMGSTQKLT